MSGGRWDYQDYRIHDIADTFEDEIVHNNDEPEEWWSGTPWPGYNHTEESLEEFKKGYAILRLAEIYAHRADWLLSGDDGEESFVRRLKENIDDLIKTDKYGYVTKILESLK